jgi:glycosyltransferase involved in cell wall biosynthesis
MLEPWSMKQKKWKKSIFYRWVENPHAQKADLIRAVSTPEQNNLKRNYKRTILIPNGVNIPSEEVLISKSKYPVTVLFMGRLHHKKGIATLVRAWLQSRLNNDQDYKLAIAGPDQGELQVIRKLINGSGNVDYIGSIEGKNKETILKQATYFILPSFSEGFPSSVIEAMSYGCIPIISEGCNFPEAFDQNLAVRVSTEPQSIIEALNQLPDAGEEEKLALAVTNFNFIAQHYSLEKIAELQHNAYQQI